MNILFVGYWGLQDGLTAATIIPHLKILASFPEVDKIIFCTIERSPFQASLDLNKVKHVPLMTKNHGNVFMNKLDDFIRFPKIMIRLCKTEKIDLMICRSSLAGALAYLVWKKNRIPYSVESFEPHAGYMIDSLTWNFYDPRYIIQNYFERRQKKTAQYLFTVSHNYERKLIEEGVDPEKIMTMPCCVSIENFAFSDDKRFAVRKALAIAEDARVGIYVGKYGDIYYDDEAFDLYRKAFDFFGETFRLIILSGDATESIQKKIQARGISPTRVFIQSVSHDQVNNYLSAADFAFSTIRPSPHRKFCSPVKNGEYWANGLPILTERGIGDDSDIIHEEGGGILFTLMNPEPSFEKLNDLLKKGRKELAVEIQAIAFKHRRMEIVKQSYKGMVTRFLPGNKAY